MKHTTAGLVTMIPVNGKEIGCQFGITIKPANHLDDGKHIIVGRVLEGMLIVRKIQSVPAGSDGKPTLAVRVEECG